MKYNLILSYPSCQSVLMPFNLVLVTCVCALRAALPLKTCRPCRLLSVKCKWSKRDFTSCDLNLSITSLVPDSGVYFYSFDSRRPWGSPRGRARGGWARWPACGWAAPHTGSGSGVGDCASSSSAFWRRSGDEGTISHLANVLN